MPNPEPEQPADQPLSEADRLELDRRLERYHQHPDEGSPWQEVIERIRQRAKAK